MYAAACTILHGMHYPATSENENHSHLTASAYENIIRCLYDGGVRAFLKLGARGFLRKHSDLTKNFLQNTTS